ncbi:potassium channel family protein [Intestinibacter sp.]|uniref:potassium channel family protein n=1 Tax=Intestinibacter sp. TaxID=1965304 RepID=UPI002A76203C|nr:potassium channel family protein [Intestinibacter sp.]MDY2738193.1 potassium channel family protein [Intestinibacter sp.]
MNCNWKSKNGKVCNRYARFGCFCVFHKKNKTKRENILFKHYLKKERIEEFTGFLFEDDFVIKDLVDYDYNYLRFEECIFYKKVDFSNFIFREKVEILNCRFLDQVLFSSSEFNGDLIIKKNYFNQNIIDEKIFKHASINSQNFELIGNINFPRLDGIVFSKESKFILRDCQYDSDYSYIGKVNYTIAQIQAERIHDTKNIGYYTYYERKYSNNNINRNDFRSYSEYLLSKILNYIAREFMGYGEHLSKLFFYIISIISVFAILYMIIGVTNSSGDIVRFEFENIKNYSAFEVFKLYIEFWYFSLVTFSTVGFGDMAINGVIGKILVCIEVFIGITVQSTWVALIMRRMFR